MALDDVRGERSGAFVFWKLVGSKQVLEVAMKGTVLGVQGG